MRGTDSAAGPPQGCWNCKSPDARDGSQHGARGNAGRAEELPGEERSAKCWGGAGERPLGTDRQARCYTALASTSTGARPGRPIRELAGAVPAWPARAGGVMEAARIVRAIRGELWIQRAQLARLADVSPSTIGRIEKGELDPSCGVLSRILDASGFQIDGEGVRPTGDTSAFIAARRVLDVFLSGALGSRGEL